MFEAALQGATGAAAAPKSARGAKLQKAKGRVGIFTIISSMQQILGQHTEGRCELPAYIPSLCVLWGVRLDSLLYCLAQLPSPKQFAAKFAQQHFHHSTVTSRLCNTKFADANTSQASMLLHHSSVLVCHNDCNAQLHHMQHVYACV